MPPSWIFVIGTFTFGLCLAFVVFSAVEMRRLGREAEQRSSARLASTPSPNAE
jgi:hypothetical protein